MFQLNQFTKDIQEYAKTAHMTQEQATKDFVYNLNTLSDGIQGFNSSINFRALGQQWGKLTSDEKQKQIKEVATTLPIPRRVKGE